MSRRSLEESELERERMCCEERYKQTTSSWNSERKASKE
jgi:hypothetical protein